MPQRVSFFSELKRRKVFRVAAAYAVAAFAVLQAVDLAVEPLRLPHWTMTLLWVLALAGFPVALAMAWALQLTPDGVRREGEPGPAEAAGRDPAGAATSLSGAHLHLRRAGWFVLGLLVAGTGAWLVSTRVHRGATLDQRLVAVLPFRVAAADPSLGYLREGMLDLLAAKLTGEGGPRAVEPRTLLSAWRALGGSATVDVEEDASLRLARRLGAASLLEGTVVGSARQLTLSAALADAASGKPRVQATVEGPPDSLPALVDRLVAQLLASGAGEDEQRVAALAGTPLPALRAYLDGSVAYRHGAYKEALASFDRALELDSTFALAALGRLEAGRWVIDQPMERVAEPAWSQRGRLCARDRALVEALAGSSPGDDGRPLPSSYVEHLAAAQRAIDLAPDRPEGWLQLGDVEFHYGRYLGHADAERRADAALARAVALDSSDAVPYPHLVELAIREGEFARARRLADRLAAINPQGDLVPFVRWRLALAAHDTAQLRRLRENFRSTSTQSLLRIVGTAVLEADGLEDAQAAARVGLERAGTASERQALMGQAVELERALGHPARARKMLAQDGRPEPDGFMAISDALFGEGSAVAADSAADRLWRRLQGAPPQADSLQPLWVYGRFLSELWRIRRDETSTAPATSAALRRLEGHSSLPAPLIRMLAETLEAAAAVTRHDVGAREALERLDRDLAAGYLAGPIAPLNYLAAQLWAARGEPGRALDVIRRRGYHYANDVGFTAEDLREEGRLAVLAGDRKGAVEAYRRYLVLRGDPEPSLRPQVEQVRRELAALVKE